MEVRPPQATALPLLVRIPEWSRETKVSVNGVPVEKVTSGTYLKIDRTWNPGDKMALELDLRLRALRGDQHVQFNTSLLRGPILLTFDQKYNTMDPADMPELDLASLPLEPLPADDPILKDRPLGPIVALRDAGGRRETRGAVRFRLGRRLRHLVPLVAARAQRAAGSVPSAIPRSQRRAAGGGSVPGLEPSGTRIGVRSADRERRGVQDGAAPQDRSQRRRNSVGRLRRTRAVTYYWQVESRHGQQRAGAVERPVVVHAGRERSDQPARGRRAGGAGRHAGAAGGPASGQHRRGAGGGPRRGGAGRTGLQRQVHEARLRRAPVPLADLHLRRLVLPAGTGGGRPPLAPDRIGLVRAGERSAARLGPGHGTGGEHRAAPAAVAACPAAAWRTASGPTWPWSRSSRS